MNLTTLLRLTFIAGISCSIASCSQDSEQPEGANNDPSTGLPFSNQSSSGSQLDEFTTWINGEKVSTKEMDALQYIKLCSDISVFTKAAYESAVTRDLLQNTKPIILIVPTDSALNAVEEDAFEKLEKLNVKQNMEAVLPYIYIQKKRSDNGDTIVMKNAQSKNLAYKLIRDEEGWALKRMKMQGEPVRVSNGWVFRAEKPYGVR